jgi:hypothetical protein
MRVTETVDESSQSFRSDLAFTIADPHWGTVPDLSWIGDDSVAIAKSSYKSSDAASREQ